MNLLFSSAFYSCFNCQQPCAFQDSFHNESLTKKEHPQAFKKFSKAVLWFYLKFLYTHTYIFIYLYVCILPALVFTFEMNEALLCLRMLYKISLNWSLCTLIYQFMKCICYGYGLQVISVLQVTKDRPGLFRCLDVEKANPDAAPPHPRFSSLTLVLNMLEFKKLQFTAI